MENWSNLNIYLTKANDDADRTSALAKELIDFCVKNDKNGIKETLKKGAHINCNDEHITPLIACMQNDNSDLAYYLLRSGSRISFKPIANFEDALWYALKNKKHNFLEIFVLHKCILSWNVTKDEKETPKTPLIYATIESDLRAVEILLSHYSIKVNERDGLGNTALHYNVTKENMSQDDLDIGRLLIAAGADTAISNLDGKSPEDLAQDFAAKAMLLSGKLEEELPVHELPVVEEPTFEDEPTFDDAPTEQTGVSFTKTGKMKI